MRNEEDDEQRSAGVFTPTDGRKTAGWVCHAKKKYGKISNWELEQIINFFFFFFGCLRQSNSTTASGSSTGEALYSNLQCFEGPRWVSEAGALAGCPKPDPAELPAWPKRQREWTATCGARLLPKRHLGYHHPQGGLPRRGLLHLHLWHASVRFKAGTDLPHCYWWVRPLRITLMGVELLHEVQFTV